MDVKISYNIYSISGKDFHMQRIVPPSHCPSCAASLEWSNDLLYCRSPECFSQASKKVEHFAKTLKIKGLGPASIEKLELIYPSDVYELTREGVVEALASEKLAEKLCYEIENSKNASLNLLLPALSIRLIGKTAAAKLSSVCKNINEINEESCEQAGLGPLAMDSLLTWIEEEFPYVSLPHDFTFEETTAQSYSIGTVCISGKLKSFKTKAEASEALNQKGYAVKSSVTKDVTHLVNESGVESVKTRKARDSGIIIIENLKELIGD